MSNARCDTCVSWTRRLRVRDFDGELRWHVVDASDAWGYETVPTDTGLCARGTKGQDYEPADPTTDMWANDGSDYMAVVITREHFHCAMYREKP